MNVEVKREARTRGTMMGAPALPRSALHTMTAAILAGGLGTRLRPVVGNRPKVLAPVHGRPFLVHLLHRLAAAGIRKTVLLTGYRAEQVFQAVGQNHNGMELVYSVEAQPLGTGGALRNALGDLSSSTVLLLNGDSWCDADLEDLGHFHHRRAADVSMVLARVEDPARFGTVVLLPDTRVERFEEKQTGAAGWIYAGIMLIARALIEDLPPGPASLERDLLPRWLGERKRVFGYRHAGAFLDIGTPASYALAEAVIPLPDL